MLDGRIPQCPTCGAETGPIAPADFHCPESRFHQAARVLTSAGIPEADLNDATMGALRLARAGALSPGTAASIVSEAVNIFQLRNFRGIGSTVCDHD